LGNYKVRKGKEKCEGREEGFKTGMEGVEEVEEGGKGERGWDEKIGGRG